MTFIAFGAFRSSRHPSHTNGFKDVDRAFGTSGETPPIAVLVTGAPSTRGFRLTALDTGVGCISDQLVQLTVHRSSRRLGGEGCLLQQLISGHPLRCPEFEAGQEL